jgi:DNA-binding CsgD family transcriptional regulator
MFSKDDLGSTGWLERLTALTRALGRGAFEQELIELLNLVLPIDHCVVFTYSEDGLGHLFTHGRMPADIAQKLADDYIERYHERDPMFERLIDGNAPERLYPLDLQSSYDPAYRNHFFDRNDLVCKASTIGRVEHGSVLCNFYRMGTSGPYSQEDWTRLERILPLITAFISAHYELVRISAAPAPGPETRNRTRSLVHTIIGKRLPPFDRLTLRESQICERILLGYTSVGIGLDLDIALSSVLTYRKRAYEKLGVTSQNELFALCLSATQRR